jgi:formamidopyrimidine-DNA glycosylase
MPELPEVETIRRGLDQEFGGERIRKVEVTGARSVRRHDSAADFTVRIEGRRLVGTGRRGKYLILRLDSGDVVVAHMGMSGQLLRAHLDQPRSKHTHVVLTFPGGSELRFVDPRTFGELFVTTGGGVDEQIPELAHLGFDPLDERVTAAGFAEKLSARRVKLKPLLMDQRFVAGIGNIYSDEILFAAGLRHDRSSAGLSPDETGRLFSSMVSTLQEAIEHRGSSLADEQYRDLFGAVGQYQLRHNVYDREGSSCSRCRATIVRVKANGRSSFFCSQCQI